MSYKNIKFLNLLNRNLIKIKINQRTYGKTYEGDGKTKVQILNNEQDAGLMINSYSRVIVYKFLYLFLTKLYVCVCKKYFLVWIPFKQ